MILRNRKSLPDSAYKVAKSASGLGRRYSNKIIHNCQQFIGKKAFKDEQGDLIVQLDKMLLSVQAPLLKKLGEQVMPLLPIFTNETNLVESKCNSDKGPICQKVLELTRSEGSLKEEGVKKLKNLDIIEHNLEKRIRSEAELYSILNNLRAGHIEGEIEYIKHGISLLKEEELKCVLEQKWGDGSTLLHLAIENQHIELAKFLVEKGANSNACDFYKRTALHLAFKYGNQELISFLQDHGADIKAKDLLGKTILHYAAINGHCQVAKVLLEKDKSLLNARSMEGNTALYDACLNGQAGMVRLLLGFGAKKWIKNHLDQTPLDCAWKFYNPEGYYSKEKLFKVYIPKKVKADRAIFTEIIDVLTGGEIHGPESVEISGASVSIVESQEI